MKTKKINHLILFLVFIVLSSPRIVYAGYGVPAKPVNCIKNSNFIAKGKFGNEGDNYVFLVSEPIKVPSNIKDQKIFVMGERDYESVWIPTLIKIADNREFVILGTYDSESKKLIATYSGDSLWPLGTNYVDIKTKSLDECIGYVKEELIKLSQFSSDKKINSKPETALEIADFRDLEKKNHDPLNFKISSSESNEALEVTKKPAENTSSQNFRKNPMMNSSQWWIGGFSFVALLTVGGFLTLRFFRKSA